jgi:hypothetical protein
MAEFLVPRGVKVVVAMKAEATAGVDVFAGTYVAADVLPVIADSIRFTQDPNEIENLMTAGFMGRVASIMGPLMGRVDFAMFPRGKGVAYSATVKPEVGLPLRGCGLSETVDTTVSAEKVTYQPSATHETMTIYVVINVPGGAALSVQLVGCIGTYRWNARAGGVGRFDFSFMGALEERADITYVAGTLAKTPAFPTFKSAAFQIGTTNYAPRIADMAFDIANVVGAIPSINGAGGIAGHLILNRNPRVTLDPEADREANSAWWAALRDGAPLKDLSFQLGTAQYNRMKIRASAAATPAATVQVVAQSLGARDGLMSLPTTLLCTLDAGEDDFAKVFD